jgi:hypothetical protein
MDRELTARVSLLCDFKCCWYVLSLVFMRVIDFVRPCFEVVDRRLSALRLRGIVYVVKACATL